MISGKVSSYALNKMKLNYLQNILRGIEGMIILRIGGYKMYPLFPINIHFFQLLSTFSTAQFMLRKLGCGKSEFKQPTILPPTHPNYCEGAYEVFLGLSGGKW